MVKNSMAVIPDNEIIVEGGGLVPSTQGASSGDVLTVGQNGPEWAAPGGGGGGGGVPDVANPLYIDSDDAVALRYGSGLTLEEGAATEDDTLAVALSGTGGLYYDEMENNGLAVQLDPDGGIENYLDDGEQVGLRVKVDGTTVGLNASGELEALGGGASYSAGAGINIDNNDTISVNHDNSLSDVAGTLSTNINGMARTFKILPNSALTMNDTLTISCSSTSWTGVGIDSSNIPGYLCVKLTSVDDSSKYVLSRIFCRKNNDEIYLDSIWSPYGLASVNFDVYENAPLSYAFYWGSLTLADIGLTSGNGAYVSFVMCDANGNQLGSDLAFSGLSSTDWTVGSSAAPQVLSVAQPVPSTSMVSTGSVLKVGSNFQPEWGSVNQVPSSTSSDENKVLTVNSSGNPEWATPSAGGGGIDAISGEGLSFTPDEKSLVMRTGRLITVGNSGRIALAAMSQTSPVAYVYNPWVYANSSGLMYLYTSEYITDDYHLAWFPGSYNGPYLRDKSFARNYASGPYTIYCSTGLRTVQNGSYYYGVHIPTGTGPEFDTSVFDVVGDWTSITTPITRWYLGFVTSDGQLLYGSSGLSNNDTTTNWSAMQPNSLQLQIVANGGLTYDPYNGYSVTNPLPSTLGTAGQVLTVNSGATGVEWAAAPGGSMTQILTPADSASLIDTTALPAYIKWQDNANYDPIASFARGTGMRRLFIGMFVKSAEITVSIDYQVRINMAAADSGDTASQTLNVPIETDHISFNGSGEYVYICKEIPVYIPETIPTMSGTATVDHVNILSIDLIFDTTSGGTAPTTLLDSSLTVSVI